MDNTANNNQVSVQRSGVQDFFLFLFCTIALYVSAISFISLLYAIINKYFPDTLFGYFSAADSSAKWAIASLIIFFPVFIWLSWLINKSIRQFPEMTHLAIRKVLYYFTMFAAGLMMAIDLVALIFYFLDGEITTRFILKVIVILLVGLTVFTHYLYDLRRDVSVVSSRGRITAIIISLIVLVAIIFGFVAFGSPVQARKIKFDNQRINDLQNIQSAVTDYYRNNNNILPKSLTLLSQSTQYYLSNLKDPETGADYEYSITAKNQYKLCATFSLSSTAQDRSSYAYPAFDNFTHEAGRVCFDRNAGELPPVPQK